MLPAGGPRGQSTHIRIDGKNLLGARLNLNGNGVAVKLLQVTPGGDQLTADIAVESGARLGPREVRVSTPKGVSGGLRFWVDVVPNRVLDQPMSEGTPPVEIDGAAPVVINSRIAAKAGRDRFTISAAAGDTWVFDCYADRIRSRFDPVLELKDEAGVSLRLVQSTWESDPRFCYKFPKAGRYFLTVRDSEYNGGPNYTYRLLTGRMGFVTGYEPRGGQPGRLVSLTLQGVNLPAASATVPLPADAVLGTYWAEMPSSGGSLLVLPLLVGTEPVVDVGDVALARPLPALPAAIDGLFTTTPRARFTFSALANAKLSFDLLGRRIGSRIDGELRVLDAAGKEIAANDDAPGLGKDARLDFTAPANGNYTLEVHNVEDVTGPDCYYRLVARPALPDFQISIATDRLTAPVGGTTTLPIALERRNGFNAPVEIFVENLPAGVTSTGGVIAQGKTAAEITFTASPNAPFTASGIRIVGEATLNGKPAFRIAPGWERYEHRSIDLLLSVEYSYERPHHLWDMLLLAVTERADPITISTPTTSLVLAPGGTVDIPVHIAREASAKGEIKIDARGLPAKVTLSATPIPAGQTEGKITLTAAPDAAPDLSNIILQAHHDKSTALAPAIRLSVTKK